MIIPVLLASHLVIPRILQAAEVDNFTASYENIKDSTQVYNQLINKEIQAAIDSINNDKEKISCQDPKYKQYFYHRLMDHVGGMIRSSIENWPKTKEGIDSTYTNYWKGVYRGTKVAGSRLHPTSWALAATSYSAYVVNVAGQKIGADKIGHFFHTGFEAFETTVLEKDPNYIPLMADEFKLALGTSQAKSLYGGSGAVKFSEYQESSLWGSEGTGIYSYADIAANYDGFNFWQNIFGGPKPFISCENDKLVKLRNFDFRDYVTAAWDETVNCNKYNSDDIEAKVRSNIEILQTQHNEPARGCPAHVEKCISLQSRYAPYASKILHPACHEYRRSESSVAPVGRTSVGAQ